MAKNNPPNIAIHSANLKFFKEDLEDVVAAMGEDDEVRLAAKNLYLDLSHIELQLSSLRGLIKLRTNGLSETIR